MIASGDVVRTSGRVVIVAHGLIRTSDSMQRLGKFLQSRSELTSVDFEYASTQCSVAAHAVALQKLIDSFGPEVTEINFVAHGLGNIVIRRMLGDQHRAGKSDPRFKRMVMIGPPNQGSRMAHALRRSLLYHLIAGSSGTELGSGWSDLEPTLATPDFEFGIIAGGQRDGQKLRNFILSGQDDFTVSVEETRLAGAHDFLVKPLLHGTMMRQQVTLDATLTFSEHGYFESAETRNPMRMTANDSTPQPHGLPDRGRLLGIDFGTVRIGIAICDENQSIASPLETYARRSENWTATVFGR